MPAYGSIKIQRNGPLDTNLMPHMILVKGRYSVGVVYNVTGDKDPLKEALTNFATARDIDQSQIYDMAARRLFEEVFGRNGHSYGQALFDSREQFRAANERLEYIAEQIV